MALNANDLATEIRNAMGFPAPNSPQLVGWAQGVINEITTNGSATFGTTPGPHTISGMTGASMASFVVASSGGNYPVATSELTAFCQGIINHIQGDGQVFYTGPNTGIPATSWFQGGTITNLDGSAMANEIVTQVGYPNASPELIAECTAIVDHIEGNAEVESGVIS